MSAPPAQLPHPREVSFDLELTFAEHLRAVRASQRHGWAVGRLVRTEQRVAAVTGAAVLLWSLYAGDGAVHPWEWVLVAVVIALCLSPLTVMLHVKIVRSLARGPRRVTLTEGGVAIEGPRGGVRSPWESIRRVCEESGLLLFDAGDAGAFAIPLRLLRNAGILDAVRELIARAGAGAVNAPAGVPTARGVSVEFTPTLWEAWTAALQAWFRSRTGRMATAGLIALPVALLTLLGALAGLDAARDSLHLLWIGTAAALALVPALGLFWAARRDARVPVRITFDNAGLTHEGAGVSVRLPWSAVRTQQSGANLLFWSAGRMELYLPMRALGGSAEEVHRLIHAHTAP